MRFYLFERQADAHIRKSRKYLEKANVRRVEYQEAAEHHNALTKMHMERIARIKAEISNAFQIRSNSGQPIEDRWQRECSPEVQKDDFDLAYLRFP